MKVADVMTADPWTVGADTPLKQVAETLVAQQVSGLPVVDQHGRVLGVISEGDIVAKEALMSEGRRRLLVRLLDADPLRELKLDARTAGGAMTAPAVTIGPRRPVSEAARLMLDEGVNRLPVVGDGRLVGILTRSDLVRAFVRTDAEIEREIREEVIARTLWVAPERVDVQVEHGEVRLAGTVETQADAELIPKFVQRVPGVVEVLSKLRWPQRV